MPDNTPKTDLSKYNNRWYKPGRPAWVRAVWYVFQGVCFSSWMPGSAWRRTLLRLFGANIGRGVVLKPRVIVKYPWNLTIGDYSWIGEKVWIDNLGKVQIGSNCCISQGALLLCGNHNYKSSVFDLMVGNIDLKNGVWIGAGSLVAPGVSVAEHSVLTAGSVLTKNTDPFGIYTGNPAVKVKQREIVS